MKIRQISVIAFIALASLLLLGYGRITYGTHFVWTCVLLVIFTTTTIMDFLVTTERKQIGINGFVAVITLGLLMGSISSIILGSQRHDIRDGGPSFGIEIWPLLLDIIFPLCFSLFIFCTSYLRSQSVQLVVLSLWIVGTVANGYIFGDYYTAFAEDPNNTGLYYSSEYFSSETKVVTPIITGTVLLWTAWIFIRLKVRRTSSRQHHV